MAKIAASDVTYTITDETSDKGRGYKRNIKIVFGDGALEYPTGGVPLDADDMGCPNAIVEFILVESAVTSGYYYDYDKSANKLKMFNATDETGTPGDRVMAEVATSVAPAAQTVHAIVTGW